MRKLIYIILIISPFLQGKSWVQLRASSQKCNVVVLASNDYQTLLEITIPGFYRSDTIMNGTRYDILKG